MVRLLLAVALAGCLAGCATEDLTNLPANEPASQSVPTSQPAIEAQPEPAAEAEPASRVESDEVACRAEAEKANTALGKDRVRTEIFGITAEMKKIYDSCMAQRPPSAAR
jgi:hypothetical protein